MHKRLSGPIESATSRLFSSMSKGLFLVLEDKNSSIHASGRDFLASRSRRLMFGSCLASNPVPHKVEAPVDEKIDRAESVFAAPEAFTAPRPEETQSYAARATSQ